MRKMTAVAGSSVFFVLAPGVVAGLVPWWLTGWQSRPRLPGALPLRIAGAVVVVAGAIVLIDAFARFAIQGTGTPAPIAPPGKLVISGLYRHIRNPMYVAVLAVILGQAMLLGRPVLLGYAAAVWLTFATWVRWYEEPTLRRRFGQDFEAYRNGVRAWLPRLRPWIPPR